MSFPYWWWKTPVTPQEFCLITVGTGEPVLVATLYSGKSLAALRVPLRVLFNLKGTGDYGLGDRVDLDGFLVPSYSEQRLGQFSTRSLTQKMESIFTLVRED